MALLEVCVDDAAGLVAAHASGAQRLELCSRLDLGGLTPERHFVARALTQSNFPCHVMLRPRAGDFVYSNSDLAQICADLEWIKASGAHGVVFGVLGVNREIDVERTRQLVTQARPLQVTFHRAFDELADMPSGLETLVELGIDRVLTSGGAADAWAGRERLRELVARASQRIVVMPGGGVRAHNARALLAATGARELHSSTPFRLLEPG